MASKVTQNGSLAVVRFTPWFQWFFWRAFQHHFGRFWDPLGAKMIDLGTPFAPKCWILVSFSIDFGCFFATDFFRPPRLPRTKQLDRKLQEHASKFKNMQTASLNKDASTKTPILTVQIAKRQQLHQTPIDKHEGGGARATWRIRIRRPRV